MVHSRSSLFFHADFRRLWTADSVSQAGSAETLVALPFVAIGTLSATPFGAGLLVMFEYLAFLIIGLAAGAWVDRMRRRRLMIAGDLCRAALLGSIPVAFCLGALTLPQLYVVAFGVSVCTTFFDVASQSFLPHLVNGGQLVEANVKLEATRSIAQVGAPGAGGALVGALTAPVAIVVNVVTFVISAFFLSGIGHVQAEPQPSADTNLRAEIVEGLRFVLGNRLLRAVTLTSAISNMCATIVASMLLVLLAGELRLSPFLCGLVYTAEAMGGLLGSLLTERIAAKIGQGQAMCAAVTTSSVLWVLALPLYQADWRFAVAVALQGLGWVAFMTFKVTSVALRQRLSPMPLLGRTTATFRFVVWGAMPVGALIGSVLRQSLGVRQAMWVGVLGELLAALPILFSPLRTMHELPSEPEQVDAEASALA